MELRCAAFALLGLTIEETKEKKYPFNFSKQYWHATTPTFPVEIPNGPRMCYTFAQPYSAFFFLLPPSTKILFIPQESTPSEGPLNPQADQLLLFYIPQLPSAYLHQETYNISKKGNISENFRSQWRRAWDGEMKKRNGMKDVCCGPRGAGRASMSGNW